MTLSQDLKARDQFEVMFEALRGILPVSRLIILVGSRSPMGPRQIMLGLLGQRYEDRVPNGLEKGKMKSTCKSKVKIVVHLGDLGDGSHLQNLGETSCDRGRCTGLRRWRNI